jgi:VanZ family protein
LNRLVLHLTAGPVAMRRWRGLLVLLVVAVSWLALTPAPPDALDTGWDKLNHAGAFAALAAAARFAFPRSRANLLRIVLTLLCFGALIEIAQSFTPPRSAEWGDLLADAVGLLLGTPLAALVDRFAGRGARDT